MQRLLSRAAWDTFAAMRVVRRFAVVGLDQAAARAGGAGELGPHGSLDSLSWEIIEQALLDDPPPPPTPG